MTDQLDGKLHVKVSQAELDIFVKKSERQLGKPYTHFIREIITAYNDGRLRIIKTDDHEPGAIYEH